MKNLLCLNTKFVVIIFNERNRRPGKKSVRCSKELFLAMSSFFPLSFHADIHQIVGSSNNNFLLANIYSRKSGANSKSSKSYEK